MAIDLDAIRKKLGQLSGNNSRKNTMWRPNENEEATIRLLSFPDNDGQPFKERWFYYGIGKNPGLLTPHQFGDADPIQELINKLRDDGSKESYELAKKLYPKMRSYAPVIVRGEEEKGVRLWAFGKTVYQSLLTYMIDEDYGDITDPIEGRDIKVFNSKAPGKQWAMTTVTPRPKQTKLSSSTKQAKEWLDNIPNLDDLYTCKTYDELEQIINSWLNDDDDSAADHEHHSSRSVENVTVSTSETTTPAATTSSLDDAFADLEDF